MPPSDDWLEAEIATREMQRATEELLNHKQRQEEQQEAATQRMFLLQQWAGAGFGSVPMPESPDDWATIPEMVRARIATDAPAVARQFVVPAPLPADTEIRRLTGKLIPQVDGPIMEEHGWLEETAALKQQVLDAKLAAFEQNHAAALDPASREVEQQEAEQRRVASQEQFNQQAVAHAIDRMHQGLAPSPVGS